MGKPQCAAGAEIRIHLLTLNPPVTFHRTSQDRTEKAKPAGFPRGWMTCVGGWGNILIRPLSRYAPGFGGSDPIRRRARPARRIPFASAEGFSGSAALPLSPTGEDLSLAAPKKERTPRPRGSLPQGRRPGGFIVVANNECKYTRDGMLVKLGCPI